MIITFPTSDRISLAAGDTIIDYRDGYAILPDSSRQPLSHHILDTQVLRAVYIDVDYDTNAEISNSGDVVFKGLIPAGGFVIPDIEFDSIQLTTARATSTYIVASTSKDIPAGKSRLPSTLIVGEKTDISTTAAQLTTTPTPVRKAVTVKVRSLGTGTYIALGDADLQPFRLNSVGDSMDIDFIDDLSKVYVKTDAGSTAALEWIGG